MATVPGSGSAGPALWLPSALPSILTACSLVIDARVCGGDSSSQQAGRCVTPDHQDPCPAPRRPQAPAWPRRSRSRGSLRGWGSRGTGDGGGGSREGPENTGGHLFPRTQARPGHLLAPRSPAHYPHEPWQPSALARPVALGEGAQAMSLGSWDRPETPIWAGPSHLSGKSPWDPDPGGPADRWAGTWCF